MAKIRKPKKPRRKAPKIKWFRSKPYTHDEVRLQDWGAWRKYKGQDITMEVTKSKFRKHKTEYEVSFYIDNSGDILKHDVGSLKAAKKEAEYWLKNPAELIDYVSND